MYLTNAGYDATYEAGEYFDEDIARDEDNYGRDGRCTCGRLAALRAYEDACYYSPQGDFPHEAFAGCRGCDPVDWECKPYGFGIESWEDAARCRALRACRVMLALGRLNETGMAREVRLAATVYSPLREEASRLVWDRMCDEATSHRQASERYKAWARRAVAFRFRDDLFPVD